MHKVHLYLFDQLATLPEGFVAEHLHFLPAFRREQCISYRQTIDQQNCVIAYLLLLQGLREQYGIDAQMEFVYGAHGKPYLKDYPHIFFNISHCKRGAVCALADFEVGVDMQDVRPYNPSIARRVCSDDELQLLSKADDPARLFCGMWAARESCAKMLGCSVADILKQDVLVEDIAFFATDSYCVAVCSRELAFDVMVHEQTSIL